MQESPDLSQSVQPLQFETAEGTSDSNNSATPCTLCSAPMPHEYHELNGQHVCLDCRTKAESEHRADKSVSRLFAAAAYGFGAAILGGLLYWGFVKITSIELGLMAIAVGWLVGKAVMKGSNQRGGRRYQFLALALTYFSITISYGALMVEELIKNPPGKEAVDTKALPEKTPADGTGSAARTPANPAPAQPAAVPEKQEELTPATAALGIGLLFLIVLASPFLAGFSNFIGWIIIAIGLFEAWKHTREVPFISSGPYSFGANATDLAGAPPALPPDSTNMA